MFCFYLLINIVIHSFEGGAKFNIANLLFPTFVAHFGFKHRFSAADVVLAATAIIENNAAVRIAEGNAGVVGAR